ncbi:MFS transporter [Rhodoplanes elegans]|nr:MFS transporter [Rhodoplanes elegans]MBK5961728.1 MFS transporter [Rhodoplanes elegans]
MTQVALDQTAAVAVPAEAERSAAPRGALAALSLSMLLASLGAGAANVALPTLVTAFGASFAAVQWVVLGYLLAVTTLIVIAGRLGDAIGRRRVLLGGLALFTVASALAGVAPSLGLLIAARVVQGTGAAVLMALTLAAVADTVPKERIGSAMGLLGTMSAVGTALGPSLGGILITSFGWRVLFLVNLPLGLVAMLLAARHLPADRSASKADRAAFDIAGTVLLAAVLAAYALAVTLGRGPLGPLAPALLAAAAVGLVVFVAVERRAASPLIRPALLADPRLGAALFGNAVVSTVMMATLVVGPFHLARGFGLDPAPIGLVLAVGPLVAATTGVPAGYLVDRMGAARTTFVGLAAVAIGAALLAAVPVRLGIGGYVAAIAVATAGYALFQAANNTAVLAAVTADRRGVVSGMLNLSRNLGLVTGASVMGAVFAAATGASEIASAPPAAVAFGFRVTFLVGAGLAAVALIGMAVVGRVTRAATPD